MALGARGLVRFNPNSHKDWTAHIWANILLWVSVNPDFSGGMPDLHWWNWADSGQLGLENGGSVGCDGFSSLGTSPPWGCAGSSGLRCQRQVQHAYWSQWKAFHRHQWAVDQAPCAERCHQEQVGWTATNYAVAFGYGLVLGLRWGCSPGVGITPMSQVGRYRKSAAAPDMESSYQRSQWHHPN